MASRDQMISELKRIVQPYLRSTGFAGSFPHFRKIGEGAVRLISFQFDRNGGGFVVEIARCPSKGIDTYWGEHIAPEKAKAWDIHPNFRKRIKPGAGGGTDAWFRFDSGTESKIAEAVLNRLSNPDLWLAVQQQPETAVYHRTGRQ